jgi:6-pyruvoyltetrahydropterin/6-carboxytetrahydropterin synthase
MTDAVTMHRYTVRVSKDYLGFCSAHFIVFQEDQCERLHGHNYRVAAELEDDLNADSLVFDFITLKKVLKGITDELDHRMLVPLRSRSLEVECTDAAVRISRRDKEWILPRGDCVLLEIENTTAELLATWIAERLVAELERGWSTAPKRLLVEVEESPGQRASVEVHPRPRRET